MIDLHIHSTCSDGSNTPKEILLLAENKKLDAISITDHDCVNAYYELKNIDIKKYYSGKIILGVELNCVYKGTKIELLAYNYDLDKMKKWLDVLTDNKLVEYNLRKEVKYLYDKCIENNIIIQDNNFLENYNPNIIFPSKYLYMEILKTKENILKFDQKDIASLSNFYRCICCNRNFPLYMDFNISLKAAKEVSSKIREFGGKAFVAHIYGYPYIDNDELLNQLVKDNIIDGIETFYHSFSKEQSNYLKEYCKKNNLLMSCGSDFHGFDKEGGSLGIINIDKNEQVEIFENQIPLY